MKTTTDQLVCLPAFRIKPKLNMLIHGAYSITSPLYKLRGQTNTLLRMIWDWYLSMASHWNTTQGAVVVSSFRYLHSPSPEPIGVLRFPPPRGININMMPFVIGNKNSLPTYLHGYWDIIVDCDPEYRENGKIWYLTIDERELKQGEVHRRPGIHIESPGNILVRGSHKREKIYSSWGLGIIDTDRFEGGIFLASNISDSCKIWNCTLIDDDVIGPLGSLKRVKNCIPGSEIMCKANKLYWITDKTPHESLPMKANCYRQFFRLVTSKVTVWYDAHSSKNPLGVQPDCTIVYGDKFGEPIYDNINLHDEFCMCSQCCPQLH